MNPESETQVHQNRWESQILQSTIAELMAFGEIDEDSPWDSYQNFILTKEKIKDLEKILELKAEGEFDIDDEDSDDSHTNIPIHSWRILSVKNSISSIPALIDLLRDEHEDDWVWFELREVLNNFGKEVVSPIINSFNERHIYGHESFCLAALVEVLTGVAKKYPDENERITDFLFELIKSFEVLPPTFTSHLIISLVELRANKALPLIQKIFEKKFNNEDIIDWEWVIVQWSSDVQLPEKLITEKPVQNNFSYSGDEKFQKLLNAIGCVYPIESIKLQIVGSILAIDMVQPSQFIDKILNPKNDEDETEGFQSEGQARYFYQEFFGLWNQLAEYQHKTYPLPELREFSEEDDTKYYVNLGKLLHLSSSLLSFLSGLKEGNTDADRVNSIDSSGFIEFIFHQINKIDSLSESQSITPESSLEVLNETHSFWNKNYLTFASDCRERRKLNLEKALFVKKNKDVGRNEPCPCGSGKKFKKCCLMEH